MTSMVKVFADLRFTEDSGLGKVQKAMLDRCPPWAEAFDLHVPGRYGDPLSPVRIAMTLRTVRPRPPAVFWTCGFVPPLHSSIPVVVTVHDLTHLTQYGVAKRSYYNWVLKPLYRRCDAIVCVSEYTRSEFLAWSGVSADKVHVVYNGISSAYAANRTSASLGYRYVLYAGNHRPYKNLARLIRAYGHSRLPKENVHLVLTGQGETDLRDVVSELRLDDYVHFIGHVPEIELPTVYRGAAAVAYVSLAEGFGLPLLEAMASGTPVITSNVSAMPEVAADAALAIDPLSVPAIAAGLDRILFDEELREELVRRGSERVKAFQWDDSARTFWNIVRRLALPEQN